MSQNYGVLRVVRVRPPANAMAHLQDKYPTGWLPEERLVHLLTHRETIIGRALSNDIVLMDPTVSREHARLVVDAYGWHVINLTMHNVVRVNGHPVLSGTSVPMTSQDVLVLGSTMLQLVAPQEPIASVQQQHTYSEEEPTQRLPLPAPYPAHPAQNQNKQEQQPSQGPVVEWGRPPVLNGHSGYSVPPQLGIAPVGQPIPHARQGVSHVITPLPVQPDPEFVAQPWNEDEEENALGAGVTMQFALPQRMGVRTRWLIAGIGITILIVSAIITIVLNSLVGISAFTQYGLSNVIAALTIPLIPALGISLLVNFIDRYEREPWFLRLAAFLWGAVIAIPPALFIEQYVDGLMQNVLRPDASSLIRSAFQGLNAGITEETIKGLGLLLLFVVLRDEFDNVTDGIVYGALIGAGFAMVENFVYFAQNSKQFLVLLIVGRIVLGWLCHSTFTVCFGASLGYIRHTRVRWRQIVVPLLGYLCAVGLHSVFDFIDFYASATVLASPNNPSVALFSLIAIIGDYVPPFIAQLVILYFLIKSLAHEAAVIREFLAAEVSSGVVRVDEYALLQNSFQRTRKERQVLWKSGIKQWRLVMALYQTEIGLAFRKWHVSMGDKPKLGFRQPEDAYRQRIKRLRQQIANNR